MDDIENKIFRYLIKQEQAKNVEEIIKNEIFIEENRSNVTQKLLELFLSKAIERNIIDGVAYYYIKRDENNMVIDTSKYDNENIEELQEVKENIVESEDMEIKDEFVIEDTIESSNVEMIINETSSIKELDIYEKEEIPILNNEKESDKQLEDITELKKEIENEKEVVEPIEKEKIIQEEITKKANMIVNEINTIEKLNNDFNQEITIKTKEIIEIKSFIQQKTEKITELNEKINELNEEAKREYEIKNNEIKIQIDARNEKIEEYKKVQENYKKELESLSILAFAKKRDLSRKIVVYSECINSMLKELNELKEKQNKISIDINPNVKEYEENIKIYNNEIQEKNIEIESKNNEIENLNSQIEENNKKIEMLKNEKDNLIV